MVETTFSLNEDGNSTVNKGFNKNIFIIFAIILVISCTAVGLIVFFSTKTGTSQGSNSNTSSIKLTTSQPMTSPNSTPANVDQAKLYLLPKTLIPSHYWLTIRANIPSSENSTNSDPNFVFTGDMRIRFKCIKNTSSIVMNAKNMQLMVAPNGFQQMQTSGNGLSIPVSGLFIDNIYEQIHITVPNKMVAGEIYEIRLAYSSVIKPDFRGLYLTSYQEHGRVKYAAVTDFEPADARKAFPCFDEPEYKAIWDIKIIHPKGMKALSNGAIMSVVPLGTTSGSEKMSLTKFEPTKQISTYLVAMFIGDFVNNTVISENTNIQVNVWARRDVINQTLIATQAGAQYLDFYTQYLNITYPIKKLDKDYFEDMLAIPDFGGGGMENWGMITYAESRLLYVKNAVYLLSTEQRVVQLVGHEIAHQWFGDLVTMKWWNDVFLNEAFATYMTYKSLDHIPLVNNAFDYEDQIESIDVKTMQSDSTQDSRPIILTHDNTYDCPTVCPVSTRSITGMFDEYTYSKGAAVLRMAADQFSESFMTGIQNYLKMYKYNNTNHDQLWNCLDQAQNITNTSGGWKASDFMKTWFLQSGYPLINVKVDWTKNKMTISQSRFRRDNSSKSNPLYKPNIYNSTWYIPIKYNSNHSVVPGLSPSVISKTVALDPKTTYVAMNPHAESYYRVAYDKDTWQRLVAQLKADPSLFDAAQKTQILYDALTFAKMNYNNMTYASALNAVTYLQKETNPIPWAATVDIFAYFNDMFYNYTANGSMDVASEWMKFRLNLTESLYNVVGWGNCINSTNFMKRQLQAKILKLQCHAESSDCVKNATEMYNKMKNIDCGGSADHGTSACSKVSADLRPVIYCVGANVDLQFLKKAFHNEINKVEKQTLRNALFCTKNVTLIQDQIETGWNYLKGNVQSQVNGMQWLLSLLQNNEQAARMFWKSAQIQWGPIFSRMSPYIKQRYISAILFYSMKWMNTQADYEQFVTFLHKNEMSDFLDSFGLLIQTNIHFMNSDVSDIYDFFIKFNHSL